jgi:hypothetical protein
MRSLRARIGAHASHATHDSTSLTEAARATCLARFLDEVDPNRVLSEDERNRRAGHARRAYFARLAMKSAQARAKKRAPSRNRRSGE